MQTTLPWSLGILPVTQWVLPFGSEQSEANKCALAAALQSIAFHVRHKTQPLSHQSPPKSQYFLPGFPTHFSRRCCGSTQEAGKQSGQPGTQGVPRHRHPPRCSLAYSGQGSDVLTSSTYCIPQLLYMYMHINCSSSILECFMMRRTKLPKEVGKVNVLIK